MCQEKRRGASPKPARARARCHGRCPPARARGRRRRPEGSPSIEVSRRPRCAARAFHHVATAGNVERRCWRPRPRHTGRRARPPERRATGPARAAGGSHEWSEVDHDRTRCRVLLLLRRLGARTTTRRRQPSRRRPASATPGRLEARGGARRAHPGIAMFAGRPAPTRCDARGSLPRHGPMRRRVNELEEPAATHGRLVEAQRPRRRARRRGGARLSSPGEGSRRVPTARGCRRRCGRCRGGA